MAIRNAMGNMVKNTFNLQLYYSILLFSLFVSRSTSISAPQSDQEQFDVLQKIPHDANAFTQGLTFDIENGRLYESTGLYGRSDIREIDFFTGNVIKTVPMDKKYFAEGMTLFETDSGEKRLIQITWRQRTGFIYDADTLERLSNFSYETFNGEGWGITYDSEAKEFIVSDGSAWLHFWDRDTLKEKRRKQVVVVTAETRSRGGTPLLTTSIDYLNEMELIVEGDAKFILVNRWQTNEIYKVDISTGIVTQIYDMTNLYPDRQGGDVLNGISITDEEGVFLVTGKLWDAMFLVRFSS